MKDTIRSTVSKYLLWSAVLLLAGCAFDVSHVKQVPVTFVPAAGTAPDFVLRQEIKATLGTGFPTRLTSGCSV